MSIYDLRPHITAPVTKMLYKLSFGNRFVWGEGLSFRRRFLINIRSSEPGAVTIGNHCFFNNDCSINCWQSISIGSDCIFGEGVKVYDHNHAFDDPYRPIREQGFTAAPVRIGDNVWLGSGVIVLAGVSIGDGCVIGANTVIAKDVPENSIVISHQDLRVRKRMIKKGV